MSDRYPAEINIGGNIPKNLKDEFLKLVLDSGGGPNFGEGFVDVSDIEEYIRIDHWLQVKDDQARGGAFSDLEAFCVSHSIDFDRHSDAFAEFDATNIFCRNGKTSSVLSTQYGQDVFEISVLREFFEKKKDLVNASKVLNRSMVLTDATHILNELGELIEKPGDLKPIKFV